MFLNIGSIYFDSVVKDKTTYLRPSLLLEALVLSPKSANSNKYALRFRLRQLTRTFSCFLYVIRVIAFLMLATDSKPEIAQPNLQ